MAIKKFCTQGQTFDFVYVTPDDVKSCIINMDSKKSTGNDGIPVKVLKVGTDPLSMIIGAHRYVHWWMYISGSA